MAALILVGLFAVALGVLVDYALWLQREPKWAKAVRWREVLQTFREFGFDIPPVRMTYSTMDWLDLTVLATCAVAGVFVTWRIFTATWHHLAQPLDTLELELSRKRIHDRFVALEKALHALGELQRLRLAWAANATRLVAQCIAAIVCVYFASYLLALLASGSLAAAEGVAFWSTVVMVLALPLIWSWAFAGRLGSFPMPSDLKKPDEFRYRYGPAPRHLALWRWLRPRLSLRFWRSPDRLKSAGAALFRAPQIFSYMRTVMNAEFQAIARTEADVLANTATVFQRYEFGSERRREIIMLRYLDTLNAAHPGNGNERCPVDVGTLDARGRLMFLPLVIGADNGRGSYDHLDFDLSDDATARYVYRAKQKGISMKLWTESLAAIETYLGGRWRVTPRDGATLTLSRLPEIPDVFALPDDALRPHDVFLGLDLNTGKPQHVGLSRLSHTLIAGPTGMGKSVLLHQLMASVVFNLDAFESVHLVDLKYGLELQDYPALSSKFTLTSTGNEVPPLLDRLLAEMDRRGAMMREQRQTNWSGPLILVVIDEFADMLLAPEKKADRDSITNKLTRLTNLSRALGFRFWVQSQKFTADAIPTQIRNNLQSLVSFRMVSNQQAAMLFGGIEEFPTDVRNLRPGQVIYRDGLTSQMYALQGAMVTFEDVAAIARKNPQVPSQAPA